MSSNHTCQNLVHTLTSHFMLNQFSGWLILRQFAFPWSVAVKIRHSCQWIDDHCHRLIAAGAVQIAAAAPEKHHCSSCTGGYNQPASAESPQGHRHYCSTNAKEHAQLCQWSFHGSLLLCACLPNVNSDRINVFKKSIPSLSTNVKTNRPAIHYFFLASIGQHMIFMLSIGHFCSMLLPAASAQRILRTYHFQQRRHCHA